MRLRVSVVREQIVSLYMLILLREILCLCARDQRELVHSDGIKRLARVYGTVRHG